MSLKMIDSMDAFILEIVKNKDIDSARSFFESMYPAMPESNQLRIKKQIFLEIVCQPSEPGATLEIIEIMVNTVGFSSMTAASYLSRKMEKADAASSPFINEAIKALDLRARSSFASAVLCGHLDIANKITEVHGEMNLSGNGIITKVSPIEFKIDGKNCNAFSMNFFAKNNEHIEKCIALAEKSGMGKLIQSYDSGGFFNPGRFIRVDSEQSITSDSISIPVLSSGIISNPELLIILSEKISSVQNTPLESNSYTRDEDKVTGKSILEKISSRITCWVDRRDVDRLKTARKYLPKRGVCISSDQGADYHVDYSTLTPESVSDLFRENPGNARVEMTLEPSASSSSEPQYYDNARVDHFVQLSHKSGFNHGDFVLCVVDTEELSQFNIGYIDEVRAIEAEIFFSSFDMTSLLSSLQRDPFEEDISGATFDREYPLGLSRPSGFERKTEVDYRLGLAQSLIRIVSQNRELMTEAVERFGKSIITGWISRGTFTAKEYANIYRSSGFNNSDFNLKIVKRSDVKELADNGFVFSDNKTILPRKDSSSAIPGVQILCSSDALLVKDFCDSGFWPSTSSKPDSTRKAIRMVTEYSNVLYDGYALHLGIDEMTKHCSTDNEWSEVLSIFSQSDRDSVLGVMPAGQKRKHIENSFDL